MRFRARALSGIVAALFVAKALSPCLCAPMVSASQGGHCGGREGQEPALNAAVPDCTCCCTSPEASSAARTESTASVQPAPVGIGAVASSEAAPVVDHHARWRRPAPPPPSPPLVRRI